MYTLVSASTLGFDLVRRPGGADVAAVVATALALGADDLPRLARELTDDEARRAAWFEVAAIETTEPRMGAVMRESVHKAVDLTGVLASATRLSATPMGHVDGLLRCLRHDVFDWTWQRSGDAAVQDEPATAAIAVVCDAAAAAYHSGRLGTETVGRLTEGWARARADLPALPAPAHEQPVQRLLDRLAGLDANGRAAVVALAGRPRPAGTDWAVDVHEMTQAVHLTGRVRDAAAAQLSAVTAFAASGLTATDAACGAWNLVSGAVQALTVEDVADDRCVQRLLTPLQDLLAA